MTDRWKNRRRMAWLAFLASLLYPILMIQYESAQLIALAPAFYSFSGLVVGAYIGFVTADDKWQKVS